MSKSQTSKEMAVYSLNNQVVIRISKKQIFDFFRKTNGFTSTSILAPCLSKSSTASSNPFTIYSIIYLQGYLYNHFPHRPLQQDKTSTPNIRENYYNFLGLENTKNWENFPVKVQFFISLQSRE